jgi:succinate dehydrogenase / fumarate reductase flavoprotein subunit
LERDKLRLAQPDQAVNSNCKGETRVVGPLPQSVLDALTDVEMPKRHPARAAREPLAVAGFRVPLYACEALVLGSGAAGLRAAVELKRRGVDVCVATQNLYGGTSACSGSDKQTLHTASGSRRGDDFDALAAALGAGGAMDEDTAYVEAVGSLPALASLQFMGLPVPLDSYGAVLRYKTDHDEAGRATSCGPRTSRLMVRALAEESARLGVPVVNRSIGAQILVDQGRLVGLLAFNSGDRTTDNPFGLAVFHCDTLVIAAGGPGELYRDSVYPKHCFGALGLALEAGIEVVNLTESQFGIGTPRDGFPWNLSGTYAQCLPYIYSTDASGQERNFLADYYRTTRELASNIFRKGYQWPFHASRMLDFGSSLVDLAIFRETQAGRTVAMDFNRNPEPVPGDAPFSLDRLDDDVRAYLANNEALLPSPILRLARMNPLSIELYKRYKKDITREPLAFAVNNQHMNGGVAVDIWGRSSLAGCYAIGEAAGTHGVTRPGGAALNAGQVFGLRCAQYIAARKREPSTDAPPIGIVESAVRAAIGGLHSAEGMDWREIEREVQARMSDHAGFICSAQGVRAALSEARKLNAKIRTRGLRVDRADQAARASQWRQMALVSEAVLAALDAYLSRGGGSRGARAICDPEGADVPMTRLGPLERFRFRAERAEDRARKLFVRLDGDGFVCDSRPIRRRDGAKTAYFERDWARFLSGAIFETETDGSQGIHG